MRKWRWRIWWAWNFLSGGYGGPGPRHFGDPCVHCGIPHDDVPVGPCQGVSTKSS